MVETMSDVRCRTNAVTRIEERSAQDRVARALYKHDAQRAKVMQPPWRQATRPKRLLYLSRAAAAIAALEGERTG